MSDQLKPCPFCGDEHPEIVSGDCVICSNDGCGMGSNFFDQWNRRTPGPATKAMIEWAKTSQRYRTFGGYQTSSPMLQAFIDEWKPTDP